MSNASNPQKVTATNAPGGPIANMVNDEEPTGGRTSNARFDVCPTWLELAIRHLSDAQVARGARVGTWSAADEHAKTGVLKWEFEASIQAITASAIALDAFCAAVQARIVVPEGLVTEWQEQRTPRQIQISEILRRAFSLEPKHVSSVRRGLEEIFRFRDLAIDPSGKMNTMILHPELGVGVEWRYAYFRYQNAQLIVNATVRLISELLAWCKPEDADLREYVDSLRANLDVLQGANALRSQAPGAHSPATDSIHTVQR
jgi:hypothetical protein